MTVSRTLLSEDDRKLLGATKKLMDELIETLDVMNSPEEMEAIQESLRQVREDKTTSWDDYKRDLKTKGKLTIKQRSHPDSTENSSNFRNLQD